MLMLAGVLLTIAAPAFACGWSKSVSTTPTTNTASTSTQAPQSPIQSDNKG
jgi:hypothetical protein